jgi:hypothetical protein
MKSIFRVFLVLVAIIMMPFFYLALMASGAYTPIKDMYKSLFDHYRSGESFGPLD